MGELGPRGSEGQHGLAWRGRRWGDREEAGAGGEVTKNQNEGASLVAQWLRIRLPMQETCVRTLVREDPTCLGATTCVHHNN